MMRQEIVLVMLILLGGVGSGSKLNAHDEVPGAPQRRPIALVNGVIHTVSGEVITDGAIVFEQGKIKAIEPSRKRWADDVEVVDLKGKHVYPGLFEAHSVRATRDASETGELNPNVEARVSVNPDSELIPVTRANGVLLAVSAPSGGLVSGMGAVLQLDGWTFEDLTVLPQSGLHVNWPRQDALLHVDEEHDHDHGDDFSLSTNPTHTFSSGAGSPHV